MNTCTNIRFDDKKVKRHTVFDCDGNLVAVTLENESCSPEWKIYNKSYVHGGNLDIKTMQECQYACVFDARCVAVAWSALTNHCWTYSNPLSRIGRHSNYNVYELVKRCNITAGLIFWVVRPPTGMSESLKLYCWTSLFFLFYQYTALSSSAVDGHKMYSGDSVLRKTSTIGTEISPTPRLIFTGEESAKFGVIFNITRESLNFERQRFKCSEISELLNKLLV